MHQLINPDTSTLPFLFVNELRLLVLRFLGSSQVMGGGGVCIQAIRLSVITSGQLIPRLAT